MLGHEDRFVELAGALNFRDLGGLRTADCGTTRSGMMFRSDALHHLEPAGVEQLLALGIRTIIDLRSEAEVERSGRGPLEATSIAWHHAPLTHGDVAGGAVPSLLDDADLGRHYVDTLPVRTPTLARVISHLGDPDTLPAIFHCTAGKDRTGVVAALVLSLVGVPDEVIVDDYTLTDSRMPLINARIRETQALPPEIIPILERVGRAEAASMEAFLSVLQADYGGAQGWARAAGISQDTLASLRAALVVDRASSPL